MNQIGVIASIAVIAALFINNIIYIKKLRNLFKYLRKNHCDKLKDWEIPDSLMDASPKRVLGLKKIS